MTILPDIYPCKPDIFAATYEAATTALPVIDPAAIPAQLDRLQRRLRP